MVPLWSNWAATPLEAVARATNPSPHPASSNEFTTKVLPVPPAASPTLIGVIFN